MFSLILVIILYMSNVCVVRSMFAQHVPLTTLKYKIIVGYERVLQNNYIRRLVHYLHQLQDLLTETVLYLSNVSCVKSTFAQQIP